MVVPMLLAGVDLLEGFSTGVVDLLHRPLAQISACLSRTLTRVTYSQLPSTNLQQPSLQPGLVEALEKSPNIFQLWVCGPRSQGDLVSLFLYVHKASQLHLSFHRHCNVEVSSCGSFHFSGQLTELSHLAIRQDFWVVGKGVDFYFRLLNPTTRIQVPEKNERATVGNENTNVNVETPKTSALP